MTSPQRLPTSLTPLDMALDALLNGVEPVAPVELTLDGSAALHRRRDAAASGLSAARHCRGGRLCVLRTRSRRRILLFAAAVVGAAGLGRGRRGHPGGLRLRARFRFRRFVRPDAAGAGGGDPGAGRAPGRRRYRRRQSRRGGRAARAAARSPDGARCRNGAIERPPSAAAHRQCPRRQRDGGSDRGERASHRRRNRLLHRRGPRCRIDCGGTR